MSEAIAIVGIGCAFPGDANDPKQFWQLLCEGKDAISEIPHDRWNTSSFFHATQGILGKTYSRWGGFLSDIHLFEPECFGISPREAAMMDPQQRLLLETAWNALEDSGIIPNTLASSNTGVFVGISTKDYSELQGDLTDLTSLNPHSMTGSVVSLAANRISYCLNLRGPSFIVDTACSSSTNSTKLTF